MPFEGLTDPLAAPLRSEAPRPEQNSEKQPARLWRRPLPGAW